MSLGLSLDVKGWSGGTIGVTVAPYSDTFAVSGDEASAVGVMRELQAWLADGARPWTPVDATWTAEEHGDTGRLLFRLYGVTSVTPSGAAATRIAIAAGAGSATGVSRGTVAAHLGTVGWDRWDTEVGHRTRSGSWRAGHRTLSLRRPTVELALDLAATWALRESIRLAAHPRRAWLWDEGAGEYRRVVCGAIDARPQADSPARIEGSMQVWGEV